MIKSKKYNIIDFINIPFKFAPVYSIITIFEQILSGIIPGIKVIYTAKFIDTAISIASHEQPIYNIISPILVLFFLISYSILIGRIMKFVKLRLQIKLRSTYRLEILQKQARIEYKHIENQHTRDLISRVCFSPEDEAINAFSNLLSLFKLVLQVISILIVFFTQIWWASLMVLIISIPLLNIAVKCGRQNYETQREVSKYKRKEIYLSDIQTNREGVLERTLFGYSKAINERWLEQYDIARNLEVKMRKKWFMRMNAGGIISVFISIFIMIILIKPVLSGSITIGIFISLINSLNQIIQMMSWQVTNHLDMFTRNKEFLKDLSLFSSLEETNGSMDLPEITPPIFESLEFKSVSFKYPGTTEKILNNISFKLNRDKHYAFVGVNGAGKSTIIKLITGLYNEFDGEILINGQSINEYNLSYLKAMFVVVYQDFMKYPISFKDNILIGNIHNINTSLGESKLKYVYKLFELNNIIEKLPNGVDTKLCKISKQGVDLSGGEWQRIAMARAIVSESPFIILDEPTASLDPINESAMYNEFEKISCNRTTIFISHRLGSTKLADEIIVIGDGTVLEQGTHDKLMAQKGIYMEMYESQRGWYK